MGGKGGGAAGPTAAQIKANDDRLRKQWEQDRAISEAARKKEEAEARAVAEQGRRDDLWKTAESDYAKVYDEYKKQFDIETELASRQGVYGATGAGVIKSGEADQNKLAQAEAMKEFKYGGKQEDIDAINKEMDRLQAMEFGSKRAGKTIKGDTMAKFQRRSSGAKPKGMIAADDEDYKYAKTLGGN